MARRATRSALTCCAIAAALAAPEGAAAATPAPRLWATVNVCDTAKHPDTVGVRASMPGAGARTKQRMYARFRLEFREDGGSWAAVGPSADSGFVRLGSARVGARRAGRSFVIAPPDQGAFLLRGEVTFEWRIGTRVVRRLVRRTTSGHPTGTGDPASFSAATCRLTAS
jgi:hypothetical protein